MHIWYDECIFKQMLVIEIKIIVKIVLIRILKEMLMMILTVGSLRIHAVQRSEPDVVDSQSDMAFDGNADWYEVYL